MPRIVSRVTATDARDVGDGTVDVDIEIEVDGVVYRGEASLREANTPSGYARVESVDWITSDIRRVVERSACAYLEDLIEESAISAARAAAGDDSRSAVQPEGG